jgi:hypothetical protein
VRQLTVVSTISIHVYLLETEEGIVVFDTAVRGSGAGIVAAGVARGCEGSSVGSPTQPLAVPSFTSSGPAAAFAGLRPAAGSLRILRKTKTSTVEKLNLKERCRH